MIYIDYDFSVFINTLQKMKDKCGATPTDLNNIKNELNRFFKDSTCKEVMYTNNTDKMFFGKESTCNAGELGSIPGLGRSPGGRHDNPLQYSCLENPPGQRSLVGYHSWGHKKQDMTERLTFEFILTEG